MCLKSLGEKDEVTILSPFKKSRNISSPTFFSYMFPSFAYSQIILSTVWRRALTVVINPFKLPRSARIPSVLFLVTGPLIHYILSPGASMKLQGHRWTVWIIRKFFPIFSWNLPPYNPAHWVCRPCWNFRKMNLLCLHLIPSSVCRQLPRLFKAI